MNKPDLVAAVDAELEADESNPRKRTRRSVVMAVKGAQGMLWGLLLASDHRLPPTTTAAAAAHACSTRAGSAAAGCWWGALPHAPPSRRPCVYSGHRPHARQAGDYAEERLRA